jgi:hypothetical protein
LPKPADRRRALAAVEGVAGPEADLGEAALAMLLRIRTTLGGGNGGRPMPFEAAAVPLD